MKIKKITLSTKYSKAFKVNFKFVVAFLKEVNKIEFYYLGKKFNINIDNDKEVYEVSETQLKEMVLNEVKKSGMNLKETKGSKRRGRPRKLKVETTEVKEKKRRGRSKKVK